MPTVTVQVVEEPLVLQRDGLPPAQSVEMAELAALVMSVRSETWPESQPWTSVLQKKVGAMVAPVTPWRDRAAAARMVAAMDFMFLALGLGFDGIKSSWMSDDVEGAARSRMEGCFILVGRGSIYYCLTVTL